MIPETRKKSVTMETIYRRPITLAFGPGARELASELLQPESK